MKGCGVEWPFSARRLLRAICKASFIADVYFDQQTGAPHVILWSKSFVSALKQAFPSLFITNGKKKEKRQESTKSKKNMHLVASYFLHFSFFLFLIVAKKMEFFLYPSQLLFKFFLCLSKSVLL